MASIRKPKVKVIDQSIRGDAVEYSLYIPEDLDYFSGHFPGHPILPGVAQIQWAIDLAMPLRMEGSLRHMERLKFMRLITPKTHIFLTLKASADRRILEFRYYDKKKYDNKRLDEKSLISAGRLTFGDAEIDGVEP